MPTAGQEGSCFQLPSSLTDSYKPAWSIRVGGGYTLPSRITGHMIPIVNSQPGCRKKGNHSCRQKPLENKCCPTTVIHHKGRRDQDKCLMCKKLSVGCYEERILYIRALSNGSRLLKPSLTYAGHISVRN
jgi:hypothetical protein